MRSEKMDGIIPLWKERGMTSHDCVFKVRKILKMKKVGHGGTLDPSVDGLLPICVGKGTKLLDLLQTKPKVYCGEITIGRATTTEDQEGDIIEEKRVNEPLSNEKIDEAMKTMIGEQIQIPPMYSAVKVNGKRLYEYARLGQIVERPERQIHIYSFQRVSPTQYDKESGLQKWTFTVECSKGTYVRTLAVDLGKKLGYPAYMSSLTRLQSGGFTAKEAVTLDQLQEAYDNGKINHFLYPIESLVSNMSQISLTSDQFRKVKNGMRFNAHQFPSFDGDEVALFYKKKLIAIYEYSNHRSELKPAKMLRTTEEEL